MKESIKVDENSQNTKEVSNISPAQIYAKKEAKKVKESGAKVHKLIVEDKIGYLRHPNRMIMSLAMRKEAQQDMVGMCEVLLENCWISGDMEIQDDDEYFYGAMLQMQHLINVKAGSLEKF